MGHRVRYNGASEHIMFHYIMGHRKHSTWLRCNDGFQSTLMRMPTVRIWKTHFHGHFKVEQLEIVGKNDHSPHRKKKRDNGWRIIKNDDLW